MILDAEEINNKPKISFYKRHKNPILWIASVLIVVFYGLFGYGVATFGTAILPIKIFVVAVLAIIGVFIITSLVIIIHELLDSVYFEEKE